MNNNGLVQQVLNSSPLSSPTFDTKSPTPARVVVQIEPPASMATGAMTAQAAAEQFKTDKPRKFYYYLFFKVRQIELLLLFLLYFYEFSPFMGEKNAWKSVSLEIFDKNYFIIIIQEKGSLWILPDVFMLAILVEKHLRPNLTSKDISTCIVADLAKQEFQYKVNNGVIIYHSLKVFLIKKISLFSFS